MLQFLSQWLTRHPARLAASLEEFIGHPAYGITQLRQDLERFAFLLGGSDGEPLARDPNAGQAHAGPQLFMLKLSTQPVVSIFSVMLMECPGLKVSPLLNLQSLTLSWMA